MITNNHGFSLTNKIITFFSAQLTSVPTSYFATFEEMLNFSHLLIQLELKFPDLPAIKIIPDKDWVILINFTEKSKQFDKKKSLVNFQVCKEEVEGIYILGNNAQSDKNIAYNNQKKYQNILSLEVKLKYILLFS